MSRTRRGVARAWPLLYPALPARSRAAGFLAAAHGFLVAVNVRSTSSSVVSARSRCTVLPLLQSNTVREILALLLATGRMAIVAEDWASGAAMA